MCSDFLYEEKRIFHDISIPPLYRIEVISFIGATDVIQDFFKNLVDRFKGNKNFIAGYLRN